ncbi:unnamed protein product, partial [Ectocarpus sp. 13 AM-2016]
GGRRASGRGPDGGRGLEAASVVEGHGRIRPGGVLGQQDRGEVKSFVFAGGSWWHGARSYPKRHQSYRGPCEDDEDGHEPQGWGFGRPRRRVRAARGQGIATVFPGSLGGLR